MDRATRSRRDPVGRASTTIDEAPAIPGMPTRLLAEFTGTAVLVLAIVGTGAGAWTGGGSALGAMVGVLAANWLFRRPVAAVSEIERTGAHLAASEVGATLGLVVTVLVSVRLAPALAPAAVGVYLAVAIVVAPSGAFANPAVTLARAWTDTPTGIAPGGVLVFLAAQATGAALAVAFLARLPARHPPRE